jgi:S1-C subfamily serine protease
MLKRIGLLGFLGTCSFLGGITTVFLTPRAGTLTAQSPPPAKTVAADSALTQLSSRFEAVAAKVSPAVVSIEAVKPPQPGKTKATEDSGSGFIIQGDTGKNSYVITNNHVITGAETDKITIGLADGRAFKAAQLWADPESDVAVLRIDKGDLPSVKMGDSDKMRVGHWVIAIGSPFGLNQSVTHGIISALDRGEISLGGTIRIKEFLQTDAPINPGSSGGPLLNLEGEVIGINTAIASHNNSNSGVAFSIPINLARSVARQLLQKGVVARGFLGLHLAQSFDPSDALKLGLDNANGALVETVYPETPAAAAGLKAGDVILQIDDKPIRNENQLINMISGLPVGQKVRLQVWRSQQVQTLYATVADWQEAQGRLKSAAQGN